MTVTDRPSHSQPNHHDDDQRRSRNHDPNSTKSQQPVQSHPETRDLPKSPVLENSQQSDKHEDALLILDGDQSQQKHSGTLHTTLPEPIVLTDDAEDVSPPPVMSPTSVYRRANKRKKAGSRKLNTRKRPMKKIQNLTGILNPIPFIPAKKLDLDKHEEVLKRLGLHEFSKIEFDRSFRTDLIVQLIANYDSKKQCSYVNDFKVSVSRADLARALKLPPAKEDSSVEEVDDAFSDEAIGFIEDFFSNWVVLHEDSWAEMVNWTRCIRDGHPGQLDPGSLIWYNVEKELSQGDKLVDCYYAPHLQYLIRSQREVLFKEDDVEEEEHEEKYEQEERDEKEEDEEVAIDQEEKIELNLGTDVEERACEGVKNDDETAEERHAEMEASHNRCIFFQGFVNYSEDQQVEREKLAKMRMLNLRRNIKALSVLEYPDHNSINTSEPDYSDCFMNRFVDEEEEKRAEQRGFYYRNIEDEVNENDPIISADAPEEKGGGEEH